MRTPTLLFAALTTLVACGGAMDPTGGADDDGSGSGSDVLEPPARGFQITTPDITIEAGQEITYCYYFTTPNTETYTVKRWVSKMTAGSHHMILFFTPTLSMPEGTVSADQCDLFGGGFSNVPSWVYSAQNVDQDLALPADDGAGVPVGMDVPAHKAGFVQLHYNNRSDEAIVAKATINAEAYDADVVTTKTAAYVTYDADITIPAHSTGYKESLTCALPAAKKVWLMSSHSHQHTVRTEVRDGTSVAFSATDWEHPGAQAWMTAPFYSFASGQITSECTWDNASDVDIHDGESAQTDEMCMASGYIFPATKTTVCFNGTVVQL